MFKSQRVDKPVNPILRSNFVGKLFFTWVTGILRLGVSRTIIEDDIYVPLEEHCSQFVANRFQSLWQHELETQINPSLLRVLLKEFGCSIFNSNTWYSLVETVLRIFQLYSLGGLVSYFTPGQTKFTKYEAFIYAFGISGSTIVMAVIYHPFVFYNFQRSLKIRVGLCSLIYDKILKLTKSTTFDGMNGQAINLMSNDISKFEKPLSMIFIIWKGPIDAIIFGYILYLEIGISAVYGVIFLTFFIPVQLWISKKSSIYYEEASKRTDCRVKFINEILQGIQVIKMYAWEKSFARIVNIIRRKELYAFRGLYNVRAGIATLYATSRISIFLCLISYIYLRNTLTARQVFMVSLFFMDLNLTMVYYWPLAIAEIAGTYVATKRITEFLLHHETNQLVENRSNNENDYKNFNNFEEPNELTKLMDSNDLKPFSSHLENHKGLQLKNISAVWTQNSDPNFSLESITFNARMNNLYAVVGQNGSGKSSLLNIIIGELKYTKGKININGVLSYAAQEPWLFDGTIRQNILFIESYDEQRYLEVCHMCGLESDFEQLPFSDLTLVGERGLVLSGGQKARVSLARTIYRKADIYLLDEPFSAVDMKVGKHIFTECIQKYLNDKCVILVTNQIQYLHEINNMIVMSNGRIMAEGSFQELIQLNNNTLLSLSVQHKFKTLKQDPISPYVQETKKLVRNLEAEKLQEEILIEGSIPYKIYFDYIKSIKSKPLLIMVSILIVLYQLSIMGVDYCLALWVNWEESLYAKIITNSTLLPANMFSNITTALEYPLNSTTNFEIIMKTREYYILVFALLTLFVVYAMFHKSFAFYRMCLRASEQLHYNLFQGISYATMLFYRSTPSGRTLNRFAKDIQVADIRIPTTLIDTLQCFMELISTGIAVSLINPWALCPTILFGILIIGLRSVYLKTSRSLNRIQALTGSPIYSHTNVTIQGLSTIRAFNARDSMFLQFSEHLNNQSGPMYLCNAVSTAFALWLDTINGLYVACIAMSCLLLSDGTKSGEIGFIISKAIVLIGTTQWGVRQSAEFENNMVSVERIMEYSNLEPEPDCFEKHPPDGWPEFGKITFSNLNLKYSPDAPYVLKNLYFNIKSEEKIGIVGRTGAGKTSITQALFRLGFIEGIIEIDHVNLSTLPLQYLRKNIAIIPQDPTLFSGSIRNNLDPFRNKSEAELWSSLEHVQMKSIVAALPDGLDFRILEGGINFSLGQRQLICLARVILRKTKILILDEATTNVDPETDRLIQTTIKNNFAQCTVLTIAHRLHNVMDSDRIMVMESGRIVEFGKPVELLKKSNGYLRKLLDEDTGFDSNLN